VGLWCQGAILLLPDTLPAPDTSTRFIRMLQGHDPLDGNRHLRPSPLQPLSVTVVQGDEIRYSAACRDVMVCWRKLSRCRGGGDENYSQAGARYTRELSTHLDAHCSSESTRRDPTGACR